MEPGTSTCQASALPMNDTPSPQFFLFSFFPPAPGDKSLTCDPGMPGTHSLELLASQRLPASASQCWDWQCVPLLPVFYFFSTLSVSESSLAVLELTVVQAVPELTVAQAGSECVITLF